jgi:hypothetical protein
MELRQGVFLKPTNRGGNEIYIVNAQHAPNLMQEIGRLREISFRLSGGGTGHAVDIDAFDTNGNSYQQLLVWNPKDCDILGGYRYIIAPPSPADLATSELFSFSTKFVSNYMPYMIELGRSFVQPNYQNVRGSVRSIYALDNLWDGIGALICEYPQVKYLFGKVTMYPSYNRQARGMLQYFLHKYFPDHDNLVTPIVPVPLEVDAAMMEELFHAGIYDKDYKALCAALRLHGESIPPLINSYMGLSPSMRTFGCAINGEFGGVEETGILLTLSEFYPAKRERYLTLHRRRKINWSKLLRKPRRKASVGATITT